MKADITTLQRAAKSISCNQALSVHAVANTGKGKPEHMMSATWYEYSGRRYCTVIFYGKCSGTGEVDVQSDVSGYKNYGEPLFKAMRAAGLQLDEPLPFYGETQFFDAVRACLEALGCKSQLLIFTH